MQPNQSRADGYAPKWRHFHPQSTVWVQNPFDHDVVFQVADEHNTPYQYRMPKGRVSELPGGAVATLGVKAIVDELIQVNKEDVFHMWDASVRAKHEAAIIVRYKEAPISQEIQRGGEVNLATTDRDFAAEEEEIAEEPEEIAFEDQPTAEEIADEVAFEDEALPVKRGSGRSADKNVANIAAASLAGKNDIELNDK